MEYAIVFLPLIGSFISGFFGKKIGDKYCLILTSSLVAISATLSLLIFYQVLTQEYYSNKLIFNWISSGKFFVNSSYGFTGICIPGENLPCFIGVVSDIKLICSGPILQ